MHIAQELSHRGGLFRCPLTFGLIVYVLLSKSLSFNNTEVGLPVSVLLFSLWAAARLLLSLTETKTSDISLDDVSLNVPSPPPPLAAVYDI